jgi:16S rRNA C967 or C1407 C5-methylase (RsmB/RsmF family)
VISSEDFVSWVKRAYKKVAFYNFEHPDGAGVMLTSDSSTPQVYILSEKIIENLGSDFKILEFDEEIVEMCLKLWGEPSVPYPMTKRMKPDLERDIGKKEVIEILELNCRPEVVRREKNSTIYKVGETRVKVGLYGFQVEKHYIPYSSKIKTKEAIITLLGQNKGPSLS